MKAKTLTTLALLGTCFHAVADTRYQLGFDYLNFSATEDRYDGVTTESVSNKYEIEDALWITLTGSHQFSSDFYGFFDLSTRQESASDNLKLLASLTSNDITFRTRRGAYVGTFSQSVRDGSPAQTEEVDTTYFSLDLQYHLVGLRYLNMSAPTVLEHPLLIDLGNDRTVTKDGLDPEFEIEGYEIFLFIDGFQEALKESASRSDWYMATSVFLGLGSAQGKMSDQGRANIIARSGSTPDRDTETLTIVEFSVQVSLAKDISLGATSKFSYACGYSFNMTGYQADSQNAFGVDRARVEQTIIQHGPSLNLGLTY